MKKMVQAVLVASLTPLAGSLLADTPKAAEEPDRVLLKWQSQQQMDWNVRFTAQGFRFLAVPVSASDTARGQKLSVSPDGSSLTIEGVTGWDTAAALVKIERGKTETVSVEIRDPYVKDRLTKDQFPLSETRQGRTIVVQSQEWPIRNCTMRFSMDPVEAEEEAQLLKTLGGDRKQNVDLLLACADKAEAKTRRQELLLRAAAAASGGCNHGPLDPNGWDVAIGTYQKVIDENKETEAALDAMWAQASCLACWSPLSGCDKTGRGKGDWQEAYKMYEKLYQASPAASDKADALRRMAEVQCFDQRDPDAGLRNYQRLAQEYPGPLPPSTRWTYRTCAPACGTRQLAWDIYRAIVYNAQDQRGVQSMFAQHFGNMKANPHVKELSQYVAGSSAGK